MTALTGFSNKKRYGCSARLKKSARNNEVAVRRGSTVMPKPSRRGDNRLYRCERAGESAECENEH